MRWLSGLSLNLMACVHFPRTHTVEEENWFLKLSSDRHRCAIVHTCAHLCMHPCVFTQQKI